jgi:hypothetical protein
MLIRTEAETVGSAPTKRTQQIAIAGRRVFRQRTTTGKARSGINATLVLVRFRPGAKLAIILANETQQRRLLRRHTFFHCVCNSFLEVGRSVRSSYHHCKLLTIAIESLAPASEVLEVVDR